MSGRAGTGMSLAYQSVTTSPRLNRFNEALHLSSRTTSWCNGDRDNSGLKVGFNVGQPDCRRTGRS